MDEEFQGKWAHWNLEANSRTTQERCRQKVLTHLRGAMDLLNDHGDRFWANHKENDEYMRLFRAIERFICHHAGHDEADLINSNCSIQSNRLLP